jgi:hypothetical protein
VGIDAVAICAVDPFEFMELTTMYLRARKSLRCCDWRCPREASRFEYTPVGVPIVGGESTAARIQSTVGLEPDARNDADHAFA